MIENSALLIVAAGKSSRFGGFPKALCQIGNQTNVENTIGLAKGIFGDVYLGLNVETKTDVELDCKLLRIETGQGDSLSLLKLIRLVMKDNKNIERLFVCWGDAYFRNSKPFEQFALQIEDNKLCVACSLDEHPYAWFDIDEKGNIIKSHFKKSDGDVEKGMHDQSLFCFEPELISDYIEEYRLSIGIKNINYDPNEKKESKLLDVFTYLAYKDPVKTVLIDKENVLSFNTNEELGKIVSEHLENVRGE